jgi:hypothetical protein
MRKLPTALSIDPYFSERKRRFCNAETRERSLV